MIEESERIVLSGAGQPLEWLRPARKTRLCTNCRKLRQQPSPQCQNRRGKKRVLENFPPWHDEPILRKHDREIFRLWRSAHQ